MVKWGGPPGPAVVSPQVPDSGPLPAWGAPRPPAVWGRSTVQASRAPRTFRPEKGVGQLRAGEPFFTKASFAGRAALEETPCLTVPPARTLPLPAQSAEARLPARPEFGGCCCGSVPPRSGGPQAWSCEAIGSVWRFGALVGEDLRVSSNWGGRRAEAEAEAVFRP